MTYEIITQEDLQKFRLQLLEDLSRMLSGAVLPQANKEWLRSSEAHWPWKTLSNFPSSSIEWLQMFV